MNQAGTGRSSGNRLIPKWLRIKAGELVPFPRPRQIGIISSNGWHRVDVEGPSWLLFVLLGITQGGQELLRMLHPGPCRVFVVLEPSVLTSFAQKQGQ